MVTLMVNSRQRDLAATRNKILEAALYEFCAKGPAGARTEAIARRAGVNKRMLFYCFGSKSNLYAEVMRRKLVERAALLESTPRDMEAALMHWCDGPQDLDWVRCVHWEALGGTSRPVAHAERRALFARGLEMLKEWAAEGTLDPEVDASQLLVAIIALSIFPLAFPHLVELITGRTPDAPGFKRARRQFLAWLASRISPPAASADASSAARHERKAAPAPGAARRTRR